MLGVGSFGQVFCGLDQASGKRIAVKQVPVSRLGIETEIQKKQVIALEHEIELLKTLQHRNIVKYLGTANTKQSINIFLEFVGGGSL